MRDGTINLLESNSGCLPIYLNGVCHFNHDKKIKLVDSCNNGLIYDIPILVHELGHLRNLPDDGRNQLNSLFTEALARTDEWLVIDYLDDLGYSNEMQHFKKYLYRILYQNVCDVYCVLKIGILYKNLGDISKESYNLYFGTPDDYEEVMKHAFEIFNQPNFNIFAMVNYLVDIYCSSYLFLKYKEDPTYMIIINRLHLLIEIADMGYCLKVMGLNSLDYDDRVVLLNSLQTMVNTIMTDEKQFK